MLPAFAPPHIHGVTAKDLAYDCRRAVIAFCRGVSGGWTKRELAEWLAGPYAAIAHLTSSEDTPPPPSVRPPSSQRHETPVPGLADGRIMSLLDPAWQDAISCIEACANGSEPLFVDEAAEWGTLARLVDDDGVLPFAPVHRSALSPAPRSQSLRLCGPLVPPEDSRGELQVCSHCSVVLLGDADRRRGQCADHQRRSDTVTLGFAPLEAEEG